MRGRAGDRERGQTAVEYVVVLALAGLILVALATGGVVGRASASLTAAVCQLFDGQGCGDPSDGAPPPRTGPPDTDGDGFSDADERIAGSDPLVAQPTLPIPPPLPRPPADPGAGEFDSEEADLGDRLTEAKFARIADAAEALGYTDAARHMRHYLAGSGEELAVSPEEMLGDMPEFQQQVARDVSTLLYQAQQEAAARYTGEPVTFAVQGEWGSFDTNGIDDNWFYAIGGFRYSTTARVTVTPPSAPGQPPTVEVEYLLHVVDRYNWDTGKGVTIGPLSISDTELGELHRKGLAQEYEVRGTSGMVTVKAPLDPSAPPPPEGDVPVPGNEGRAARDGDRTDPGRDRGRP